MRMLKWLVSTTSGSAFLLAATILTFLICQDFAGSQRALAQSAHNQQAPAAALQEHKVKFGTDASASIKVPADCIETALDPHGSKGRVGIGLSYPDSPESKGLTVQLVVTCLTGQDRALPPGEALQNLVTQYDDTRRKDGQSVLHFSSSYTRDGGEAGGEVTISMLTAPNHIGWTELRAVEVGTADGKRYLVQVSITGFKAGLNKECPTAEQVRAQFQAWQTKLSKPVVEQVLKSLLIAGKELRGASVAQG